MSSHIEVIANFTEQIPVTRSILTPIKVHLLAATRPNFMKIAPLWHELAQLDWVKPQLIDAGQHYEPNMSRVFWRQFGLPEPYAALGAGSGTHAEQTGAALLGYERLAMRHRPDLLVVVGDVNSTMACALAAAKLQIPIAHLEAGLRSHDRTMPEEINRIITDSVAQLLWTHSPDADENLRHEGKPSEQIMRVGNIMIDCFIRYKKNIAETNTPVSLGLEANAYGVVTLHRPSNVDHVGSLIRHIDALNEASRRIPLVFSVHPRTRRRLIEFGLVDAFADTVRLIEPIDYFSFMSLVSHSRLVITDSGGVQEETTYLNIPCLTLRKNTERPITVTEGSNELIALDLLVHAIDRVLAGRWKHATQPEMWDGLTATRIVKSLARWSQRTATNI